MQQDGFQVAKYIVGIGVFLMLASFCFPLTNHSQGNADRSRCQKNLQQIGIGFKQYLQDYDEKFPPFDTNYQSGWVGLIQPYLKNSEKFQCPSANSGGSDLTDYFYNLQLSKVEEIILYIPDRTILAGDGSDNSPRDYALSKLPSAWLKNELSPARRHLEGANYAFADGHIKWFRAGRIVDSAQHSGAPTFAIN